MTVRSMAKASPSEVKGQLNERGVHEAMFEAIGLVSWSTSTSS